MTVPWPTEAPGPIHAAVGIPLSKVDSPFAARRPEAGPRPGSRNLVPILAAPPFAPPAFGDAGDPGALTGLFLIPMLPAHRPALVAASAIGGFWVSSSLCPERFLSKAMTW